MNTTVQKMILMPESPLRIERDWSAGHEIIVIEGVRYDADYFRTFGYPQTDVLYAIVRDEDCVMLTVIGTPEQAEEFFSEIGRGDPAPTEDENAI